MDILRRHPAWLTKRKSNAWIGFGLFTFAFVVYGYTMYSLRGDRFIDFKSNQRGKR